MKKLKNRKSFVQMKKMVFMCLVGFFSFVYPRKKKAKKQIGYLMSFPRNDNGFILKMMEEMSDTKLILFYTKNCTIEARFFSEKGIETHSLEPSFLFFKVVVFRLCQSKLLICDNYYAFLGALQLDKKSKVIQLWHANGAIKCFGWEDMQTNKRTWLDQKRFSKVYRRFDEYIVGSKRMGAIFQRSYGAKETQMKYLGYPRTDPFFDIDKLELSKSIIYRKYPELKSKKLLLYAPTYRAIERAIPLDINQLAEAFSDDYFLVIKAHPYTIKLVVEPTKKEFYYQALAAYKMEELLPITDCLITDYSSIPFDYSIVCLAGKIIFYWYDYSEQKEKIGIQSDFEEWNPGTIVFTMENLIKTIRDTRSVSLANFNQEWNQYNDGNSTMRVVSYLKKLID